MPERSAIHRELIDTAIEELEHFKLVFELMQERKINFSASINKDPYVKLLIKQMHSSGEKGSWIIYSWKYSF
ncbi:MAG: tRNA isopentenyl-2-thiomethyl-A-37 hydroxylase MiaE [Saprospiraceae bacterium]